MVCFWASQVLSLLLLYLAGMTPGHGCSGFPIMQMQTLTGFNLSTFAIPTVQCLSALGLPVLLPQLGRSQDQIVGLICNCALTHAGRGDMSQCWYLQACRQAQTNRCDQGLKHGTYVGQQAAAPAFQIWS